MLKVKISNYKKVNVIQKMVGSKSIKSAKMLVITELGSGYMDFMMLFSAFVCLNFSIIKYLELKLKMNCSQKVSSKYNIIYRSPENQNKAMTLRFSL
jgi:hypothetical protein